VAAFFNKLNMEYRDTRWPRTTVGESLPSDIDSFPGETKLYSAFAGEQDHEFQPPDHTLYSRYTGIPTFMRVPYVRDVTQLDIAMVGVPFDSAVTNRPGARHGPREVRNQSSLIRRVHHVTGVNPYDLCKTGDAGDTPANPVNLMKCLDLITEFYKPMTAAGVTPLSVGSDHLITLPIFRAIAKDGPVGMVHFDAHMDTADEVYNGEKFHHGTPFRRAVEEGLLDPKRVIQIGICGSTSGCDYHQFSHDSGMRLIYIEEFFKIGVEKVIAEARRVVGDGPTYVSFNVDGLDPVYALSRSMERGDLLDLARMVCEKLPGHEKLTN
jgi:guanidinopropionase